MTETSSVEILQLKNWGYNTHFLPVADGSTLSPEVAKIEQYIQDRNLASHPFFAEAAKNRSALELWLTQELVMTNAFSQIVLMAAARISNVHVRAILAEVAYGEHGRWKNGLARGAHPWLLHRLGQSVGLRDVDVSPTTAVVKLIETLAKSVDHGSLNAIAWIGVGNERLIIPEYTAITECFKAQLPTSKFEPFLKANLTEDVRHSKLCYEAASALIQSPEDAELYYREAIASVEGRWLYFDALLVEATTAYPTPRAKLPDAQSANSVHSP